MNDSDTPPAENVEPDPFRAGEHDIFDIPEELIVSPASDPFADLSWRTGEPPFTEPPRRSSAMPPLYACLVLPVCAVVVVAIVCLAAFLAAPALFRLDPTPGVVHLILKDADGTVRNVPCDAEGYCRLRPGTYRFTLESGGLHVLTKELTLNSRGEFFEGKTLFEFDRVTCRLVVDTGMSNAIPFINGARAELKSRTIRLPAGRYDLVFLAEGNLSDIISIVLPAGLETLHVDEFPWRFRDGNRSQHEHALSVFFGTLYALDPLSWNTYAPGEIDELIDFFYQVFCVPSALPERFDEFDETVPRREEDDSFERRLSLLRERIRLKIQKIILDLDATVHPDADAWPRLLRATAPWEDKTVEDWRFHHARCLAFFHTRQWSAAEEALKKGLEAAPSEPSLHTTYARLLAAMSRFEEARGEVAEAFKLDPARSRKARKLLAEIAVQEIAAQRNEEPSNESDRTATDKKLLDTLSLLDEALKTNPEDGDALYLRSLVYIGLNREAEADKDWREFEKQVKPEMRAWLFDKELERERWKERFRNRPSEPSEPQP